MSLKTVTKTARNKMADIHKRALTNGKSPSDEIIPQHRPQRIQYESRNPQLVLTESVLEKKGNLPEIPKNRKSQESSAHQTLFSSIQRKTSPNIDESMENPLHSRQGRTLPKIFTLDKTSVFLLRMHYKRGLSAHLLLMKPLKNQYSGPSRLALSVPGSWP